MLSWLSITDYVHFLWDLLSGQRTRAERHSCRDREQDCSPYLDLSQPQTILDLANGALRPQATLLASQGHRVIGVDLVNSSPSSLRDYLYVVARFLFRIHLPKIPQASPHPIYIHGRVERLPLTNESVDLVTSAAAFEHFLEIPEVIRECYRVLKDGGIAWIAIHVFTTFSGGHNIGMRLHPITRLPKGVEPWDHLREQKLPFTVPLNKWRIQQYISEIERHFEIIKHGPKGKEGQEFLTPEVRESLSLYTEEELTCGTYLIVARKNPSKNISDTNGTTS